jgi:hypothetical protein
LGTPDVPALDMHVYLPDTHTGTPAASGAAAALHWRCSRTRGVRGRYVAAGAGCLRSALRDEISLACEDPGLRVERVLDTDRGGDDDDSIASDLGLPAPAGRVLKVPFYQDACAREPLLTQRPPAVSSRSRGGFGSAPPALLAVSWNQYAPDAMVRWRRACARRRHSGGPLHMLLLLPALKRSTQQLVSGRFEVLIPRCISKYIQPVMQRQQRFLRVFCILYNRSVSSSGSPLLLLFCFLGSVCRISHYALGKHKKCFLYFSKHFLCFEKHK